MTTFDLILDGVLLREGPGKPPYLTTHDAGGRTAWGIAERWHPEAWRNGPPTYVEARAIYEREYVAPFRALRPGPIAAALIDDAVLSGGAIVAIKRLQHVLGVPKDGIIGPVTLGALTHRDERAVLTQYTVERAIRITRLVQRRPADLVNLTGWITRILGFLL